jgi:hypothetical protein
VYTAFPPHAVSKERGNSHGDKPIHTNLQHLTLVMDLDGKIRHFFRSLVMPSLKTFTIQRPPHFLKPNLPTPTFKWPQSDFITMLKRSGCNLERFALINCYPRRFSLESLLKELPSLIDIYLDSSIPVAKVIFEMMMRGEILQNLQYLSCFTSSPCAALDCFKHYMSSRASNSKQDFITASITCDPSGDEDERALEEFSLVKSKMREQGVYFSLRNGD